MTNDANIAKPLTEDPKQHRGPLPPLQRPAAASTAPTSGVAQGSAPPDLKQLDYAEAEVRIAALIGDPTTLPLLVKMALDSYDPKLVIQKLREGFNLKIAALRDAHVKNVAGLQELLAAEKISQSEFHVRVSNSDGKIRSMEWFANLLQS